MASGNLNDLFTLTGAGGAAGTYVVPAQAGTHTLRIFNWNETLRQSFLSRGHGGYGSPPARDDIGAKEKSRLAAGLSFSLTLSPSILSELAVPLALLALAALAVRILLLLAGLLAAALLLAGLLTRVLILLARILVLAGHSGSP
jgi:hypothetical protein